MLSLNQTTLALAVASLLALSGCSKSPESAPAKSVDSTEATADKTAESNAETSAEENTATATASSPFKIGSDLTYPPYEFLENDKPAGFDIELMNGIAAKAGTTADYVDTRFTNLIPGLDGKKYDAIISALYVNEDRLKKYNMIPYFTSDQVVLVKTDSAYQPAGKEDLCGKTIATMKGAILAKQLQEISDTTCKEANKGNVTIREFPTSPEAIQAVLSGSVDALYDDAALGTSAVKKLAGKVKISSTGSFFPTVGGIVVRKDDQATYDTLNKNLTALHESGEYDALISKYGLKPATEADIADLRAKVAGQ